MTEFINRASPSELSKFLHHFMENRLQLWFSKANIEVGEVLYHKRNWALVFHWKFMEPDKFENVFMHFRTFSWERQLEACPIAIIFFIYLALTNGSSTTVLARSAEGICDCDCAVFINHLRQLNFSFG